MAIDENGQVYKKNFCLKVIAYPNISFWYLTLFYIRDTVLCIARYTNLHFFKPAILTYIISLYQVYNWGSNECLQPSKDGDEIIKQPKCFDVAKKKISNIVCGNEISIAWT